MILKKVLFMMLFMMFINCNVLAKQPEINLNKYYLHGEEPTKLAMKIEKMKDKYYLKYKSYEDLIETCKIICELSKYTNFTEYDVAAISIKESKLSHESKNKNDGGKGLMMLTKLNIYHPNTLFWINKPYDKWQNITGGLIVLEENLRIHKTKFNAIKRYNGSTYKSTVYAKDVLKLKQELKLIKI